MGMLAPSTFSTEKLQRKQLCGARIGKQCVVLFKDTDGWAWAREMFKGCIKNGTIHEIINPYVIGNIAPECLRYFVSLALSCMVVKKGIRRPSMDDVLRSLQSSLQLQEAWENSVEMGDELHMTDIPGSYDYIVSANSEFSIGRQSFLILEI